MMAGCFTLDLYCDNKRLVADGLQFGEVKYKDANHSYEEGGLWQYTGETRGVCYRQARRDGWVIGRNRHLCPRCSGKTNPERRG